MIDEIHSHREELQALYRRFHVRRLNLFGSAACGDFDWARSDLDFLVEFDRCNPQALSLKTYFGFKEALEALLKRPVDLVEPSAMRNPYLKASVERSRELLFAGDPKSLLWDAGDAADVIATITAGKSFADFDGDIILRSAIERQFEVFGKVEAGWRLAHSAPPRLTHATPRYAAIEQMPIYPAASAAEMRVHRCSTARRIHRIGRWKIQLPDIEPFLAERTSRSRTSRRARPIPGTLFVGAGQNALAVSAGAAATVPG